MPMKVESAEHSSPELQHEGHAPDTAAAAAHHPNRAERRQACGKTARKEARKVPYLAEREGRYYFVRRYPQWMLKQGFVTEPASRVSLKTTDRLRAERQVRVLAYRFDRLVEAFAEDASTGQAPGTATVSAAEVRASDIPVVARRFEALLLHSDDFDRSEKLDELELLNYAEEVQDERLALVDAASSGDVEAVAEQARSFLEAENLECKEGTDVWKQLLKSMMLAQLRALNGIWSRLDGATVETPPAPAPVRSDDDLDDLDKAFEHWQTKTRPGVKTLIEARSVWRRLTEFTGKTRISTLTRAELLQFQASEGKRTRGGRPIRPQTVNKLMGLMRAIFTLACDDLLTAQGVKNPLEKMRKEKVKNGDVTEKQDLSQEQLEALFRGAVHQSGYRPVGGAGEAAFWLPILGHATGARMRELAQLSVHEVVVRDGVTCLWLTNRDAKEEIAVHELSEAQRKTLFETSLKTGESRRFVPVHDDVLALGFIDYVESVRAMGSHALFPDLRPDCKGNIAGNFSKWFNGYLGRVRIKQRGVDWISFRHTLKTYTREADVKQDIADYLEGHSAERASKRYGRFPPLVLHAAMHKLSFPALKLVPRWTRRGACWVRSPGASSSMCVSGRTRRPTSAGAHGSSSSCWVRPRTRGDFWRRPQRSGRSLQRPFCAWVSAAVCRWRFGMSLTCRTTSAPLGRSRRRSWRWCIRSSSPS